MLSDRERWTLGLSRQIERLRAQDTRYGNMRNMEVEVLRSMYTDDELKFTDAFSFELHVDVGESIVRLFCHLPEGYPDEAAAFSVACEQFDRQRLDELGHALRVSIAGCEDQEMQVLHAIEFLKDRCDVAKTAAPTLASDWQATSDKVLECLTSSLAAAGFSAYGRVHVHEEKQCTVELREPASCESLVECVLAMADGVSSQDLSELLDLELQANPDCAGFGARLLQGIRDMRYMAGSEAEPEPHASRAAPTPHGSQVEERLRRKLPNRQELSALIWPDGKRHINELRPLQLLSWGDALLSRSSEKLREAQFHVNAKMLNGRGGGADTKQNALEDARIVLNVADALAEGRGLVLLRSVLRKVEEEDLHCISIFCSKGRHRSVSLTVLLKLIYYPNADIRHLTIT